MDADMLMEGEHLPKCQAASSSAVIQIHLEGNNERNYLILHIG